MLRIQQNECQSFLTRSERTLPKPEMVRARSYREINKIKQRFVVISRKVIEHATYSGNERTEYLYWHESGNEFSYHVFME